MSKDFKWHSGSSYLQNGEGEKLKQILLGFIISHLIVANCKKIEEHFAHPKWMPFSRWQLPCWQSPWFHFCGLLVVLRGRCHGGLGGDFISASSLKDS